MAQKTLFSVKIDAPKKKTQTTLLTITSKPKIAEDDRKIYELINRKRRQMLIHSCIYYRLSDNIIDDVTFDTWARELVKLQADYPHIAEKVPYHDAFKTWDGTTGFDLPLADDWVVSVAMHILKVHKEGLHGLSM